MILDISDNQFKDIMQNPNLSLPVRWDGHDFEKAVANLLDEYMHELYLAGEEECADANIYPYTQVDIDHIEQISSLLMRCIREYHNGFPATAFGTMKKVMNHLMKAPLRVYQKSGDLEPFETDQLYLFRLRGVNDAASHTRKDIFHVPSCARSMISTCRYSIAGYPSLYLTTSVDLGIEEVGNANFSILVSRFKLIRQQRKVNIRVLELGIRPQDFSEENREYINREHINRDFRTKDLRSINLRDSNIRANYLQWYPLIAACSFIRADKKSPFASEYIIPQLLMQWVREQIKRNELMGIRYFSCASVRASELGFDYVFPVSNTKYAEGYCSVLRDSFLLTKPVYLRDYGAVHECERSLIDCNELDRI